MGLLQSQPLDEQVAIYNSVLQLGADSLSYPEIVDRIVNESGVRLSKSTVSCWTRGEHTPQGRAYRFDQRPSPELAYIIGVVAGDGSLSVKEYAYRIRLQATDPEFVEEFDRCLSKVLGSPRHAIWRGAGRKEYHVEGSGFLLHEFLQKKVGELRIFIEHDERCVSAFLRGFFDSGASVSKRGDVVLYDPDSDLLVYVQELLCRFFGIETTGPHLGSREGSEISRRGKHYYRNSNCYNVYIRRSSLPAYLDGIGFSIARKQKRFLETVLSRENHPLPYQGTVG